MRYSRIMGEMESAEAERRRYVILAEGAFGELPSKTAMGVIQYGREPVVAVIDSERAGRDVAEWLGPEHRAPVVATFEEALAEGPTALLLGIAPQGGRIRRPGGPSSWPPSSTAWTSSPGSTSSSATTRSSGPSRPHTGWISSTTGGRRSVTRSPPAVRTDLAAGSS